MHKEAPWTRSACDLWLRPSKVRLRRLTHESSAFGVPSDLLDSLKRVLVLDESWSLDEIPNGIQTKRSIARYSGKIWSKPLGVR